MEHLIELNNVYKIYHMGDEDVHALDGVSLTIDKGEFVAIVGQSGSGKSTFLRILTGELDSTNGSVTIDPTKRVSVLKQNQNAYDDYTVMDTVIMGNQRLYDCGKEKDAIYAKDEMTDEDGIRAAIRERCAGLREIPATPLAVEMGNARVFNSVMMGGLAQLVGGDADVWRSVIADRVAPKVRDLNVRAFDAGLNHTF